MPYLARSRHFLPTGFITHASKHDLYILIRHTFIATIPSCSVELHDVTPTGMPCETPALAQHWELRLQAFKGTYINLKLEERVRIEDSFSSPALVSLTLSLPQQASRPRFLSTASLYYRLRVLPVEFELA